jgi:hypothetical protein
MNITDLQKKYSLSKDDFWELRRGGKAMQIISHDACEKIAATENIQLLTIETLNSERDFVRFLVTMQKGEKKITTVGEADKSNCTSSYYGAMAEKRGIDRAILKLINAYEYGVYSDVESDDFAKKNPEQMKVELWKDLQKIAGSVDKAKELFAKHSAGKKLADLSEEEIRDIQIKIMEV